MASSIVFSASAAAAAATIPAKSIPPFTRAEIPAISLLQSGFKVPPTPSNFRYKDATRLRLKKRLPIVFASKTGPSGGDSLTSEESDVTETSDSAPGPPFLTILAGVVVFFLVFWSIGSIVTWLVCLIGNLLILLLSK